jgi:hypothetical protein
MRYSYHIGGVNASFISGSGHHPGEAHGLETYFMSAISDPELRKG